MTDFVPLAHTVVWCECVGCQSDNRVRDTTVITRTSASLLERLRTAPDGAAWERFVEIYGPLLYGWLREFGLQHHDACDLGQDVLVTVIGEMPKFHYDRTRGSFRGWLRTIMSNRLRGIWRARRTQTAGWASGDVAKRLEELADSDSKLSQRLDREHDGHVVSHVMDLLKFEFEPATWQAFWLTVVDGEKSAAAAKALGISRNAVYLAKSRVLRRLRREADGLLG